MVLGALRDTDAIPRYQISAFLMAVYFQGMTSEETGHLTSVLIESGTTISLAREHAPYVDKHSTGGVGDGTSLIIAPILAACGVHVPMISGRALGHTGGTLDKLESIPGYRTQLSSSEFVQIVEKNGYAMCGQTQEITPADKYLYGLRDVTATVESIPLITSSILSKKFAEGTDVLVIDVKYGRGAFASTIEFARKLSHQIIETGRGLGKVVKVVITDMDQPLGIMIGNFLEIEQAAVVLRGYENPLYQSEHLSDYIEVSKYLCAQALVGAEKAVDVAAATRLIDAVIADGSAWEYFCKNVSAQNGELDRLRDMFGTRRAAYARTVHARQTGYVHMLDARAFGLAAVALGVGRSTVDSPIDADAGIQLSRKAGDRVTVGDPVCILYSNTESTFDQAESILHQTGITISDAEPKRRVTSILETAV